MRQLEWVQGYKTHLFKEKVMVLNKYNKHRGIILGGALLSFLSQGTVGQALAEPSCGRATNVRTQKTIMLSHAQQTDGFLVINQSGDYQLAENIEVPILVLADHVQLDFHGHTVYSNRDDYALVSVGPHATHVYIHDGVISGYSRVGVFVEKGASHIELERLKIRECDSGILCSGTQDDPVRECSFKQLELVENNSGARLTYVHDATIKECDVNRAHHIGFDMYCCESVSFLSCHVHKVRGGSSAVGFKSTDGTNNLFHRCVVRAITSTAECGDGTACGIVVTGKEIGTKITDSSVHDVSGVSYACGIRCMPDEAIVPSLVEQGVYDAPARVMSSAWTHDGRYLACGCVHNDSCSVALYAPMVDGLSLVGQCAPSAGDVLAVAWSPDGQFLASGDTAGFIRIFGESGVLEELTHVDITSPVSSLAWSPDGKYLACGDADKNIRLYVFDGHALALQSMNDSCMASVLSLCWSPNGKFLVSGDFAGAVRLFALVSSTLQTIAQCHMGTDPVWSVAWAPHGCRIAVGDQAGRVFVLVHDENEMRLVQNGMRFPGALQAVHWSPDATYLACADLSGALHIVHCDGENCSLASSIALASPVQTLAWSFDGQVLVGAADDARLYMYSGLTTPQNCLIENCRACDVRAAFAHSAFGIAGCSTCMRNICCNNDVNYNRNIGNVVYGEHNAVRRSVRSFDNVSMPVV